MSELSKTYDDIRRELGWFIGQSREPGGACHGAKSGGDSDESPAGKSS